MSKTLGVSLIVKNEADCIRACLESVKDADEIVIVDTGSEDDTVNICKEYTKHVYSDAWDDNFARSRSISLSHCSADWILIIDADEVLKTPIKAIKKALDGYVMNKYLGILFDVRLAFEGLQSIRIVKNIPEIQWQGAIHNTLLWTGGNLRERCYHSSFVIESGFSPAHKKDPDRTVRILQKQLDGDANDTRALYYMAREYINRKDTDKVIEYLTKYFQICWYKPWTNELADACYLLALAYIDKKDWHSSVMYAVSAVLVLPTYKAPMIFLSAAFKGHYPLASAYWNDLASRANDAGILFQRDHEKTASKIIKP